MRRIVGGILLLAGWTWAFDTNQGQYGDPTYSQGYISGGKSREVSGWIQGNHQQVGLNIGINTGGPFKTKNDQGYQQGGLIRRCPVVTGAYGGLISGRQSGGPFGRSQGNYQQGGLISGSNTGGPFRGSSIEDPVVTGGLISGGQSGGPFGRNQGNYQQGGLISGSNTGGPFRGSSIEDPVVTGGLISGGQSGGPFGRNQGNYQHGGLISGSNTGGPFNNKHYQREEY